MSGKTELRIYHNRRFHAKPTLGNVQLTHKFLSNIVGAVLFWLPFFLFFNKLSQQPDLKLVFRHKQLEFPSRWFNFVWLCCFYKKSTLHFPSRRVIHGEHVVIFTTPEKVFPDIPNVVKSFVCT